MLDPSETALVGKWIHISGSVDGDAICKRIQQLTQFHLKPLGISDAGWSKLFVDPSDGRYWELTYPQGEWHGGGPPTLTHISEDYAKSKYDLNTGR